MLLHLESRGFNTTVANSSATTDGSRLSAVYDGLFVYLSNGDLKPQIGLSMTTVDGIVWTLKLRPNVKFSDGTPFDAEAVRFNWALHMDSANRSVVASTAGQIDRLDVTDPLTVTITLKARNTQFDTASRALTMIMSPKAVKEKGLAAMDANPVGAGPFLLKEWSRGDKQVFVRNPTYWQAGKPYIDQLTIKFVQDDRQRYDTVAKGDADMMWDSDPSLQVEALKKGLGTPGSFLNGGLCAYPNTARAPFDDVRMRQVLQYGIDRKALNDVLYNGSAELAEQIFRPGNPLLDNSITQPAPDRAKAQALIDSYVNEKNGGKPVEFTFVGPGITYTRSEMEFIQQQLNTNFKNIKVNLDVVDSVTLQNRVIVPTTRNFQLAIWGCNFVVPELELYNQMRGGLTSNYNSFNDPQMNTALDRMRTSKEPSVRKAAMAQVLQVLYDQANVLYLHRTQSYWIHNSGVTDVQSWSDNMISWENVRKT